MQDLPITRGDLVRVRRARWRTVDVRPFERCTLLTLAGLDPDNTGVTLRVLAPFDTVRRIDRRSRPKPVRPVLWRRACRALLAAEAPPGTLASARRARMELFSFQLEPALAFVRGLGSRALLADEVGLGKTIQAGLVAAELGERGAADRVLVLTPPGLRDQWVREFADRLDLEAAVVDVAGLRRLSATLPMGINPWTTLPIAVASIDYVKRPEVLPAVMACSWDLLIVDEAHTTVGGSDRHAAVSAIGARAAYVLLVTATPHSGDREAFASLCGIGAADRGDRLLVFRRTRRDVGVNLARRVHRLSVRPSPDEARMHALLGRFTRAVRQERGEGASLALSVLYKRAFSSARSLGRSVERRLDALSGIRGDAVGQLALPVGDGSGELGPDDEAPPWPDTLELHDVRMERRLLGAVAEAARAASGHETKIAALIRLLARIHEPAIVFTEYRDTLLHLELRLRERWNRPVAILHGGMTRDDRIRVLEGFDRGDHPILVATDAAGQGLNLHRACRVVVNLELPWNPMRLEQRIGRVDRLGQRRTVHAFHLVARDTGEALILERLRSRLARARADIGVSDPLGADVERDVAGLVIDGHLGRVNASAEPTPLRPASEEAARREEPASRIEVDLKAMAARETERLSWTRSIVRRDDMDPVALVSRGPLLATARSWRTRSALQGRIMQLWSANCEDTSGRHVSSILVPLMIELSTPARQGPDGLVAVLERIEPECRRRVEAATETWRAEVERVYRAFVEARLNRERSRAELFRTETGRLFQVGLFDQRAVKAHGAAVLGNRGDLADPIIRVAAPPLPGGHSLHPLASKVQLLLLLLHGKR